MATEPTPRTFYLNEQHELTRGEKPGGGSLPKLAPIDWSGKGRRISSSLTAVKGRIQRSKDPLKDHHYFLLAKPTAAIKKESKNAPNGVYDEQPNFAGSDYSRVFYRLGMDLLSVNKDGSATVHAAPEKVEHAIRTTSSLDLVGRAEQARWVSVDAFGLIPDWMRIDQEWLQSLQRDRVTEVVIELQPLLARTEIEDVAKAIAAYLQHRRGEKLTGTGSDLSGRQWYRGLVGVNALTSLAHDLFSIQSMFSPIHSRAAGRRLSESADINFTPFTPTSHQTSSMPTIAVLDTGVPGDHRILRPYRRGGYADPTFSAGRHLGDHGSLVASRAVFGDPSNFRSACNVIGNCTYYDVNVACSADDIEDQIVVPSMSAVLGTAPDVRVFNLSFDDRIPLDSHPEVARRERLLRVQELDNFVFINDVVVVVSAGNPPEGVTPALDYPDHFDDPNWALGHWAEWHEDKT